MKYEPPILYLYKLNKNYNFNIWAAKRRFMFYDSITSSICVRSKNHASGSLFSVSEKVQDQNNKNKSGMKAHAQPQPACDTMASRLF